MFRPPLQKSEANQKLYGSFLADSQWVHGEQQKKFYLHIYIYQKSYRDSWRERKVDNLIANKTQKLNWLISNKRKEAKTQRNLGFNSQNRYNVLN